MLSVAFLAVLLGGTGCFFTNATIENLGETRWRYSTYNTALSPDESEVIIKYRKKTEHDCWPFLIAWHVTWDTNSFEEERFPFENPDGEDVDLYQYASRSMRGWGGKHRTRRLLLESAVAAVGVRDRCRSAARLRRHFMLFYS